MPRLRIAFLAPEFVHRHAAAGGLASYLEKISLALAQLGHEIELFIHTDDADASTETWQGLRIHNVPSADNLWTAPLHFATTHHWRLRDAYAGSLNHLRGALGLARAFQQRHREEPFDLVQSSEYGLTGFFLPRLKHCKHLVRCSSAGDLLLQINGTQARLDSRLLLHWERRCIAKADIAYAPSQFTADHYRRHHGLPVRVLRPPLKLETGGNAPLGATSTPGGLKLPAKYLLFLGKLSRIKGADLLAEALTLAWRQAPDLRMVWAGAEDEQGMYARLRGGWGETADHVQWLGAVERRQVPALLRQAVASVVPSRCDNLPNTVLESLALGVPVIGYAVGGMDEVILPGFNGRLVAPLDVPALAQQLVAAWQGELNLMRGKDLRSPAMMEMEPLSAARALIRLAGYADDEVYAVPRAEQAQAA